MKVAALIIATLSILDKTVGKSFLRRAPESVIEPQITEEDAMWFDRLAFASMLVHPFVD